MRLARFATERNSWWANSTRLSISVDSVFECMGMFLVQVFEKIRALQYFSTMIDCGEVVNDPLTYSFLYTHKETAMHVYTFCTFLGILIVYFSQMSELTICAIRLA